MNAKSLLSGVAVAALMVALAVLWFQPHLLAAVSDDPAVWEREIRGLERQWLRRSPPAQPVVFVGSSSIRLWSTLADDMAPLPVVRAGFGGATLNDVVHYADRLVRVHDPSAVVIFAGSNDIIDPRTAKSPEQLLASYREFLRTVRAGRENLPVFFLAITPTPARWRAREQVEAANQAFARFSASDDHLHYVETAPHFIGADGKPIERYYASDGLHLSAQGYELWTQLIKPVLTKH